MNHSRRPPAGAWLLLVLVTLGSVAAMHGVSAHAAVAHHATAGDTQPSDHTGGHHGDPDDPDDDGSSGSGEGCTHAASLCASIIGGLAVVQPRPGMSTDCRVLGSPAPPTRSWSPEPPVPRRLLVNR